MGVATTCGGNRSANTGRFRPSETGADAHKVQSMSTMSADRDRLRDIVAAGAVLRLSDPVELSSGGMSDTFVDVKKALSPGANLRLACEVIATALREAAIEFDAVGGMTMGADQFSYGVAMVADKGWFVVRKEPKGRGTNRLIEGLLPTAGVRAVVVEDTVSTGTSLLKAIDAVRAEARAEQDRRASGAAALTPRP